MADTAAEQHASGYVLPWPPTVNTYYRSVGRKVLISEKGRAYRQAVLAKVGLVRPRPGRLAVTIRLYPPDRRRRDIDNCAKAILDALQAAGVYEDDCQIDRLTIDRAERVNGGQVVVTVKGVEDGIYADIHS